MKHCLFVPNGTTNESEREKKRNETYSTLIEREHDGNGEDLPASARPFSWVLFTGVRSARLVVLLQTDLTHSLLPSKETTSEIRET